MRAGLIAGCLLAALPGLAFAGPAEGEKIAQNGNASGSAPPCIACHGEHGEGQAGDAGVFPRLAGLSPDYFAKQIEDFRDGRRVNEIMQPIAAALTPEEARDVADYYAALKAPPGPAPEADAAQLDLGRRLATIGKWEAGVPPCVSCHAPEGVGVAPDFPYLAGQHAAYMTQQFEAWRNGQRHNDPLDLMKSVALHLTADEAAAAAAYFQSLAPPAAQGRP